MTGPESLSGLYPTVWKACDLPMHAERLSLLAPQTPATCCHRTVLRLPAMGAEAVCAGFKLLMNGSEMVSLPL